MDTRNIQSKIDEIPRLFYIYLTLIAVYLTVSVDLVDVKIHQDSKPAVEAILQLLELTSKDSETSRPLTLYKSQNYFGAVWREMAKIRTQVVDETDKRLATIEDMHEGGFDDSPVERSFIHQLTAYSRPISNCEVAVTQLQPGVQSVLLTFGLDARVEIIDSASINVVTFSQCKIQGWRELNALMFRTEDGIVFGLPDIFIRSFPALEPELFELSSFDFSSELKEKITGSIRQYIALEDSYYTFSESMLSYHLLQKASILTGESFRLADIDEAARAIFRAESQEATFLGITSSAFFIVTFSPIVFLFLSWNIWRRTRATQSNPNFPSRSNWFVFDSHTVMDKLLSTLVILIYLSSAVLIPYLFILSRGSGLIISDSYLALKPWLNLTLEAAPPRGYVQSDWAIGLVASVIFALNIMYVIKATNSFLRLTWRRADKE